MSGHSRNQQEYSERAILICIFAGIILCIVAAAKFAIDKFGGGL